MQNGFVIFLILALLAAAVFSLPNSSKLWAEIWYTVDGYRCEHTDLSGHYTCCKKISIVVGKVNLEANRCYDCSLFGVQPGAECGPAYHTASAVTTDVGGEQVNPKFQNYAKGVIGQGLAILNEETRDAGPVDPQVKNNVKTLFERGLQALSTGNVKTQADPNIAKNADHLITQLLSDQKNKIGTGNIVTDKGNVLSDPDTTGNNNEIEKDNTLLKEASSDLVNKLHALDTSLQNFEKATKADSNVDDGTPDTAEQKSGSGEYTPRQQTWSEILADFNFLVQSILDEIEEQEKK